MIFYGNSDKIVTNWGENFGDLHELVIIKVMQLSLYQVTIWVKILSLQVVTNSGEKFGELPELVIIKAMQISLNQVNVGEDFVTLGCHHFG